MSQSTTSSNSVPNITETDLVAFHAAHFTNASQDHFSTHFLGPVEDKEEDDGLGYYPDGVKRTLTDEQIAIFRHSELETLRRERRHAEEARDANDGPVQGEQSEWVEDAEDGEVDESMADAPLLVVPEQSTTQQPNSSAKGRNKKQKNKKGNFKQNVKPDLRKRTWDKVEQGLGGLDYGEDEGGAAPGTGPTPGRRRISYEDV